MPTLRQLIDGRIMGQGASPKPAKKPAPETPPPNGNSNGNQPPNFAAQPVQMGPQDPFQQHQMLNQPPPMPQMPGSQPGYPPGTGQPGGIPGGHPAVSPSDVTMPPVTQPPQPPGVSSMPMPQVHVHMHMPGADDGNGQDDGGDGQDDGQDGADPSDTAQADSSQPQDPLQNYGGNYRTPPSASKGKSSGSKGKSAGKPAPKAAKPAAKAPPKAAAPQQPPAPPMGQKTAAGDHVATHVTDPYSAVKDSFGNLHQAKMNYELEKQKMVQQLAPVKSVIDGISNMHRLDTPDGTAPPNPDAGLGMSTPNAPGAQVDPATGNPMNMGQQPGGQMQSQQPSKTGFTPGASPGPAESVRPPKMGMPQPGQGNASTVAGNPSQPPIPGAMPGTLGTLPPGGKLGQATVPPKPPLTMPGGWGPVQNTPGQQFNPAAQQPQGAGQLPGANGPGDPKVAGQVKKAQSGSKGKSEGGEGKGRGIKIQVHADRAPIGAPTPLAAAMGVAKLRSCNDGKR
jgi:hypothetical protein